MGLILSLGPAHFSSRPCLSFIHFVAHLWNRNYVINQAHRNFPSAPLASLSRALNGKDYVFAQLSHGLLESGEMHTNRCQIFLYYQLFFYIIIKAEQLRDGYTGRVNRG